MSQFIPGIIIGLTLAAPVGPIALMCIRRTVAGGRLHGIASGIGVATADTLYAAVTVLGLTAISGLILSNQILFRAIACIVLIIAGVKIFTSVPPEVQPNAGNGTYLRDYLSMLGIAIANPLTLIFFITVLPGLGIVLPGMPLTTGMFFVAGVFLGSCLWWVALSSVVGSLRTRIGPRSLIMINRVSGAVIACFGAGMLLYLLFATLF